MRWSYPRDRDLRQIWPSCLNHLMLLIPHTFTLFWLPAFWQWAYLMKVFPIFWLWAYLMKVFPIFWLWAFFLKHIVPTILNIYVFIESYRKTYNIQSELFVFVLCLVYPIYCLFLWIVHSWLSLRFSLTFIDLCQST